MVEFVYPATKRPRTVGKKDNGPSDDKQFQGTAHDAILGDVLATIIDGLNNVMDDAQQPLLEHPPVMDQSRKIEYRKAAFHSTINTLQRSYTKVLHETFEGQNSSKVAASVQHLAKAIVWKLKANCVSAADEAKANLKEMLEHILVEFKWMKIINILEEAIEVARANKATSYEYIRDSEHKLRNIRQAGDSN